MAKLYYDQDADLKYLERKTVAILGYGSQGHAHAQNLRASGVNVVVGERDCCQSWKNAVADGFSPKSAAEAAAETDVIMLIFLLLLIPAWALPQEVRLSVPYTMFTLPNGLTVILHEDHTTPTVSVNTWYHVGLGREKPGKTGFAHLFEHLMFMGSGNVPEGKFDQWLEAAGGNNNGSTTEDRTNYFEDVPSNAIELPLFLESDRMAYLLTAMTEEDVNLQRDVVKNERRQNYEDAPYGMASIILGENLFPPDHPYHWPTIGYMQDLSATSYQDVVEFFRSYYGPNNASLSIAGDIDPVRTRALIEKWFADVPTGRPADLSHAAASQLGFVEDGVIRARIELI